MEILNDFSTSVQKAFDEIDSNWRDYEGLVVCGTHTPNMPEVAITLEKLENARTKAVPTLGICFGLQLMAIEYARNVLNQPRAYSEEFPGFKFEHNVVVKLPQLIVGLKNGESYWHNYEVIPEILEQMEKKLFRPNYLGVQFHPEYQSRKEKPHPLLVNFLETCKMSKKI